MGAGASSGNKEEQKKVTDAALIVIDNLTRVPVEYRKQLLEQLALIVGGDTNADGVIDKAELAAFVEEFSGLGTDQVGKAAASIGLGKDEGKEKDSGDSANVDVASDTAADTATANFAEPAEEKATTAPVTPVEEQPPAEALTEAAPAAEAESAAAGSAPAEAEPENLRTIEDEVPSAEVKTLPKEVEISEEVAALAEEAATEE